MNPENTVKTLFKESIQVKQDAMAQLSGPIVAAADLMIRLLGQGGKILSCGNGGSAGDAQHFSSELLNRFETDRRGLAAIALTTDTSALTSIANDFSYNHVFTRQLEALGRQGDALLAISTSGDSQNVVAAVEAAQAMQIPVVALTGKAGGEIAELMTAADIEIRVPSDSTARIQEVHLLVIHAICRLIDDAFS